MSVERSAEGRSYTEAEIAEMRTRPTCHHTGPKSWTQAELDANWCGSCGGAMWNPDEAPVSERTPLAPEGEVVRFTRHPSNAPKWREVHHGSDARVLREAGYEVAAFTRLPDSQAQEITEGRRDG